MENAIKSAIECLETVTYEDGHRRHPSFQDWVDLNDPKYGNVREVLRQLREALNEGLQAPR